ncbi:MAG: hypothetical protein J6L65_07365 [Lachnospiraceae bacterium]|nr:hypothetical protein [Lachnospiraceae bacterium]
MKKYERPVVMVNEELAEGVYAASGCWTSGAENHQTRATGRDNFCFQVSANHIDEKHVGPFVVTVYFDKAVSVISWDGYEYLGVKGVEATEHSFHINQYNQQNYCNGNEKFGAGGLYVTSSDADVLSVTLKKVKITDGGLQ